MNEQIQSMRKGLESRLAALLSMNHHPRLHLTEHFSNIRNEIDYVTERSLIVLSQPNDNLQIEKINAYRTQLISELDNHEKYLLEKLSEDLQKSEFSSFFNESKRKAEKVGDIIKHAFERPFTVQDDQFNILCLEDQYEELFLKIIEEANMLEQKILYGQSFIFLETTSELPGILVHFTEVYFNPSEIKCFK